MPNKKCKVKKQVPRTVTLSKELAVHYVDIGESLSAYLQADYNIHDPKWIVNDFFYIDSRVRFKVGKFAFLEKKPQIKSQFFKSDELFFPELQDFFVSLILSRFVKKKSLPKRRLFFEL